MKQTLTKERFKKLFPWWYQSKILPDVNMGYMSKTRFEWYAIINDSVFKLPKTAQALYNKIFNNGVYTGTDTIRYCSAHDGSPTDGWDWDANDLFCAEVAKKYGYRVPYISIVVHEAIKQVTRYSDIVPLISEYVPCRFENIDNQYENYGI